MVHQETISSIFSSFRKEIRKKNQNLLKQDFHELQLHYADDQHIYTDGSKDKRVFCAVLRENDHQIMRISDGLFSFHGRSKSNRFSFGFS